MDPNLLTSGSAAAAAAASGEATAQTTGQAAATTDVTEPAKPVKKKAATTDVTALDRDELVARAAKQADKSVVAQGSIKQVVVRVLKKGAGKISTGQHVPGVGEVHYEFGETFSVGEDTALDLEERGFAEIQ
ncbi:hypothetical protein [Caulobacter sp. NIBR2454]|uniref:hypothetical protein n=1 Tax=Caulobacter sp. NIBR2454 TaxID=3015996 RepID=UPI0022B67498|nr:hypothetical protein [Caulobacter sp. NIBR2454]